jgi:hypothetical protein
LEEHGHSGSVNTITVLRNEKKLSTKQEESPKKRKIKRQKGCADYNLAYMKLWWARMDREGRKAGEGSKHRIEENEQSGRMKAFLMDGKLARKTKTEFLAMKNETEDNIPSKLQILTTLTNIAWTQAENLEQTMENTDVTKERHL